MIAYKLEENERHMEPFVQNFDPDFYKTLYSDIKNFSIAPPSSKSISKKEN